jgi:hypothetical protein
MCDVRTCVCVCVCVCVCQCAVYNDFVTRALPHFISFYDNECIIRIFFFSKLLLLSYTKSPSTVYYIGVVISDTRPGGPTSNYTIYGSSRIVTDKTDSAAYRIRNPSRVIIKTDARA